MSDDRTMRVGNVARVVEHLLDIEQEWIVPMKFTFLARNPAHPDGSQDLMLTDDDIDAAIEAMLLLNLRRSRFREMYTAARTGPGAAGDAG